MKTVLSNLILAVVALSGCLHVKTDPIQVETIHIQHEITIGVDKALEDFFAFQEKSATTTATTTAATTAPTTQTAQAGDVQ